VDTNKNITDIIYNHLNLPETILFSSPEGNINYKYSATGVKLEKAVMWVGSPGSVTSTQYAGAFIYDKTESIGGMPNPNPPPPPVFELQFISHPEGYAQPNTLGTFDYIYQYKDHLGNIRLSYKNIGNMTNPDLEILEENNFYPFGLKQKGYNNNVTSTNIAQKFTYNGKEFEEELGLNSYDFSARSYMPDLGRWKSIDPHADSYLSITPYSSFANNPISFVDPTGEDIRFYTWEYDAVDEVWNRTEVKFNELDDKTQKALEAFAKTDAGNEFFASFAKKGDKIGDVEFGKDGKNSNHDIEYAEFNSSQSALGTSSSRGGNDGLIFDIKINTNRPKDNNNVESMAVTNGHEAFIHISQYMSELIEAYNKGDSQRVKELLNQEKNNGNGQVDHAGYIGGDKRYQEFKKYLTQLKTVLNPASVDKQIKSHDSKYKDNGERRN
jgi:RHS repeat-associated protein